MYEVFDLEFLCRWNPVDHVETLNSSSQQIIRSPEGYGWVDGHTASAGPIGAIVPAKPTWTLSS